jgi:hypothetical protein
MCSVDNQNLINAVLDDFIGKGQAFTAFEVSIEAKKRGATERHRDMRDFIHQCQCLNDELQFGGYEKTLVPVGGGNKAFLYHHNTFDPSGYVPLDTSNNAPSVFTGITNQGGVSNPGISPQDAINASQNINKLLDPSTQQTNSDIGYKVDYRNRLLVPTNFLRSVPAISGQRVNVVKLGQGGLKLVGETVQIDSNDTATQQVVERNGDIRLSLTTLLASGLQIASDRVFQIETSTYGQYPAVEIFNIDLQGVRL